MSAIEELELAPSRKVNMTTSLSAMSLASGWWLADASLTRLI
jgi:hypothetical protein